MRLNKYLAQAGVCSRRAADQLIKDGQVTVNGSVAVLGTDVTDDDEIYVKKQPVQKESQKVLLCFHKPPGIVCTASKKEPNNLIDYLSYPVRIFPVGRLDKESRGLLLLTNDGDLANELMRARNAHEREYIVRIDREVTADFLNQMAKGVYLPELDQTTRPCQVKKRKKDTFSIILTQGLNRQIRRMCKECGAKVLDLKRVRIEHIMLDGLKEGTYRNLTPKEETQLYNIIKREKA